MKALSRLTPALLRTHPQFRRFWTGQTVSLIGDQVTFIALPLVAVLALDASAAQMGYLTAAALIPNLLFSLHAGAFVDRRGHRRQLMILADVGRGLLLALVPLTAALGLLSLPVLYVIAFLTGSLSVLFMVAYSALFVALVPRDGYVGAQSLLNGSRAVASVVGPSLGGMLVQALTAPLAIAVDAVSYAVSAAYLLRVKVVEPPREEERRGLLLSGARFIASSPIVRPALLATATLNFFDYAFLALFVLYATRSLGVAPGTLGVVLGAGAVGAVIGAAATGRVVRRIGVGPVFVVGCVLFPVSLLLVPLAGGPHSLVLLCLLAAEFGAGLGVVMLDISIGSIFAAVIPDRFRSRVSGAYMVVNYGVRPLGSLAGGALATAIGTRETLWIAAAGGTLAVLWLVRSPLLRMRELPEARGGGGCRRGRGLRPAGAGRGGRRDGRPLTLAPGNPCGRAGALAHRRSPFCVAPDPHCGRRMAPSKAAADPEPATGARCSMPSVYPGFPDTATSIRPCAPDDVDAMVAIINGAATVYAGVIPADRYHQPYMPIDELRGEIAAGVRFWGWAEVGEAEPAGMPWASRTWTT